MISRHIGSMATPNKGYRSLTDSSLAPELSLAIKDWPDKETPILIGGLAYSYWCKPRYTQDIDLLFPSIDNVDKVQPLFKKTRPHCFIHLKTGVELEILDCKFLNISTRVFSYVSKTKIKDSLYIASKEALIILKAHRMTLQDKADIEQLLVAGAFLTEEVINLLTPINKNRLLEFFSENGLLKYLP